MSLEASKNAGKNAVRVNWSHLLCLQTQIFCVSVCHHNSSNKALGDIHWGFCGVSSPVNERVVLNLSNHLEGSDLDCSSSLTSLEESNINHRHWTFQLVEFNIKPASGVLLECLLAKVNSYAVYLNCSTSISSHTSFTRAAPQTFGWSPAVSCSRCGFHSRLNAVT